MSNKCQHDKKKPMFFERGAKNTYDVIHTCIANLQAYYFNQHDYLYNLRTANDKAMRTERREAVAIVAQILVNHMQLTDLQAIKWNCGKPTSISVNQIVALARLSKRRVEYALTDLRKANYLLLRKKGRKCSEKRLTKLFFKHLHIDDKQLLHCQQVAKQAQQNKQDDLNIGRIAKPGDFKKLIASLLKQTSVKNEHTKQF